MNAGITPINLPWHEWKERGIPTDILAAIQAWIPTQRWFLSKGDARGSIRVAKYYQLQVGSHPVWWLILEVPTATVDIHRYQLPLALIPDGSAVSPKAIITFLTGAATGWLVDGWAWIPFAEALITHMNGPELARCGFEAWFSYPVGSSPATTIEIPQFEQSNTAVRYGDEYYLKAFRFLTKGIHPEEEIGRHVGDYSKHTPKLLAVLYTDQTTLAVIYRYEPNEGTAWTWFLDRVKHDTENLLPAAEQLGQVTADLHRCLALPDFKTAFKWYPHPLNEPAFGTDAFTPNVFQQLQTRLVEQSERLRSLLTTLEIKDNHLQAIIDEVCRHQGELVTWITHWNPSATVGTRIRVHGDFHLGQVLRRTDGDWVIIDFEGEPLRLLVERRAKDSPLRDVAGMRRSFEYLADALHHDQAAVQRVATLKLAFTEAYFNNMASSGLLPDDASMRDRLLRLYELEKTLYEVEYEIRSRPECLGIPLRALYEFVRGVVSSDARMGASNVS